MSTSLSIPPSRGEANKCSPPSGGVWGGLELDTELDEGVVEDAVLVEVAVSAVVGDGTRGVARAPQFVVSGMQGIADADVEREIL